MALDCSKAAVSVNIIKVDQVSQTVIYETDAKKVGATNSSSFTDRRVRGRFQCQLDQIWHPPVPWNQPPPVPDPEVALGAGNAGWLYLPESAFQAQGMSVVGACNIRGSYKNNLLSDERPLATKWPDCLPFDNTTDASVVASRVVVVVQRPDQSLGEVDLLDSLEAAGPQEIFWDGASPIRLVLTNTGMTELGVTTAIADVWPVRIQITGVLNGRTFRGRIDLRNQRLAGVRQRFRVDGDNPVTLRLTPSGLAEFGAASPQLRAALTKLLSLVHNDKSLRAAFEQVAGSMEALERLHHASDESRLQEPASALVDELFARQQ